MDRTLAQEWQYARAWDGEAGRASALNHARSASPLSRPCGAPAITARATMRTSEIKTQSPSGSRGRAGVRISNLPPWPPLLCMVIYIKEEATMRIRVSSTLAEYHDGQFLVGLEGLLG